MAYLYHVHGERDGQSRKESCTSARKALTWIEEMSENGWNKITVVDEQGNTVTILALQGKAAAEAGSLGGIV